MNIEQNFVVVGAISQPEKGFHKSDCCGTGNSRLRLPPPFTENLPMIVQVAYRRRGVRR